MPPTTPTRPKSPPADFSIVSLIRSLCRDAELLPGEGQAELAAVAVAGEQLARNSSTLIRGHVLPIGNRAESGGLNTGTLATGGALVSTGSITLAEALAPVLMIERLGARRVQGQMGDQLVSSPGTVAGFWVGEDQDTPKSTALFGAALREPREAAVRIETSRRLWKQSGSISEQEFRSILQRSISETVEKGILNGSGANSEPLGLLQDQQLQRRTYSGGQLPTRARAGELVAEIAEAGADVDSITMLVSSADYDAGQAGGSPVVEITADGRRRIGGVPCAFSPYIPSGNVIVADWSRIATKYVGPPQLTVNPYTKSDSGILELTLFQQIAYAVERRELLTVATVEA
jgi:HK97 family phage major capsid protein